MFRVRATRRAPKVLLLLTVTATAVLFLAPAAQAAAGLSVAKTASPADGGTVSPGDTIAYTVVVGNAGPDTATSLTVTDPVPAGTSYVADSASVNSAPVAGASNPFESGYPLPDLGAGLSHTLTFSVTVDSPLANGSTVANTASASSPDDPASPVQSSTSHTVASAPSLTVSKTSSPAEGGSVAPGDTVTYTVVVGNSASATDTATGVTLTDPLPANTSYVADSGTEDGSPVLGATNPFESGYPLTDSTLDPGETHTFSFDVDVDSPLPNGTVLSNSATARAANAADASDSATHTVASAPGLAVDKTSTPAEGSAVAPGDAISYSIVVSNDALATDTATNVVLTDATPVNTTYVADSATVDTVVVPGADNPFESGYALPDMPPGASHSVTFDVLVDPVLDNGTVLDNTANLDSDQGSAVDSAGHTVQSQSTLTLDKTSTPAEGGPVTPGTTITYSMVVTNDAASNEVADQIVLTDPTPLGTAYVGNSAAVDGASIFGDQNPLGEGLDLPDLAPGESVTVTYDVVAKSPLANGTVISNLAALSADNHPDISDEATHTVDSSAVMRVDITAIPVAGAQVKSGDTIEYAVKVTNEPTASESLVGVNVSETPPAGTTLVQPTARTADGSDASAEQAGQPSAPSPAPQIELKDAKQLVDYIWWLLAHSEDPTEYIVAAIGINLSLDGDLAPIVGGSVTAPDSILLVALSKAQLLAFRAAHPEVSMTIDRTLLVYDDLRPYFEYMLGQHQVDLGLATSDEVPYIDGSKIVLRTGSAAELATMPAEAPAQEVTAQSESAAAVPLGDLAPGESATTTFRVSVGPLAAGQLTNTVSVAATNHPTVVATTNHTVAAPAGEDEDDGDGNSGGGGDNGGGRAFGDETTTTTVGSGSVAAGGESLAFTGLDLARLVLLAMSLLLAGWVLLSRGQVLQRRAVIVPAHTPAYEVPEGRYAPRTWFFLPGAE